MTDSTNSKDKTATKDVKDVKDSTYEFTNFMLEDQITKVMLDKIKAMFPSEKPLYEFMTYHAKNPSVPMSIWSITRNPKTGELTMVKLQQS